jgi:small-conductance mechanosensitive channel
MELAEIIETIVENEYTKGLAITLIAFVASFVTIKITKLILVAKLQSLSKKTTCKFDDLVTNIVNSIGWPLYFVISLFVASKFVEISDTLENIIRILILITVIFYTVKAFQEIIDYTFDRLIQKTLDSEDQYDPSVLNFFAMILKILLWIIAIIVVLQNLGYNVNALVGGIGIMGIAIGFAMQNVLSDIFSFISIYFDKPFKTGDYIQLNETDSGTVEKIGIKSTRIRTVKGQELVVPNAELTSTRINNSRTMEKRRVSFTIGIAYKTPQTKLKKINKIIKEIISKIDELEFSRSHFKEFGEYAYIYEIVFKVNTKNYTTYMDKRQEVNLKIIEAFEKENIEIAYPTRKVFSKQI